MSRSNNEELVNPADKFFDWSGANGTVTYYDKSQEKNITMPMPFTFLVLDRVAQVTGGVDTPNGYLGYWSNAIKYIDSQPFTVRSKNGVVAQGFYKDIKTKNGIKFMTGLYIAYKEDRELKIGYLKIKGSALGAWIEATKGKNIFKGAFSIIDKVEKKKGSNTYYEPVIAVNTDVSDETNAIAVELDKELQQYMNAYFKTSYVKNHDDVVDQSDMVDEYDNFVPDKDEKVGSFDDKIPF